MILAEWGSCVREVLKIETRSFPELKILAENKKAD
jgi:hypothetical protein